MVVEEVINSKVPAWAVFIGVIFLIGLGYFRILHQKEKENLTINYQLSVEGADGKKSELRFGPWPSLSNADFFGRVRAGFLTSKKDFIEADLSLMKLTVYKAGEPKLEVPILTKGKKGSWWETPAGIYQIRAKEENHFSSFGKVIQPWSMQFQGNFFIHGWPYYPDGTSVSSSYSGGCIRLSTEDAGKVYALTSIGMPVLIYESDFSPDNFVYHPKTPNILGREYLAADLRNNFVFLEKNSGAVLPIASVTKLMTGMVAAERINLDKKISIPQEAIVKTSKARLAAGEEITAYDLLFPLLEESSNEAAEALARSFGRSAFIRAMNENAKSLGMDRSVFTDPAGSDDGNVASPEDLFNLVKYLYNSRSFILDITAGREKNAAYTQTTYDDLQNFNGFSEDPSFVGGKIGLTTAASSTMVSVFNLSIQNEKRPVVIVVLGSEDAVKDTAEILKYIKAEYQ